MRTRNPSIAILAASLLSADVAFAAAAGGVSFWTIGAHALNLAILVWLIVRFAKAPAQRALRNRAETVTHEIQKAKTLHAEARTMLTEYESKLAGLEAEMAAILDEQRREGEAEKARLIEEARTEAARIRREAQRVAESELARARARLESEIVDRAIEAAEAAVRAQMNPADHRRLTADYLSRLEESYPVMTRTR